MQQSILYYTVLYNTLLIVSYITVRSLRSLIHKSMYPFNVIFIDNVIATIAHYISIYSISRITVIVVQFF